MSDERWKVDGGWVIDTNETQGWHIPYANCSRSRAITLAAKLNLFDEMVEAFELVNGVWAKLPEQGNITDDQVIRIARKVSTALAKAKELSNE